MTRFIHPLPVLPSLPALCKTLESFSPQIRCLDDLQFENAQRRKVKQIRCLDDLFTFYNESTFPPIIISIQHHLYTWWNCSLPVATLPQQEWVAYLLSTYPDKGALPCLALTGPFLKFRGWILQLWVQFVLCGIVIQPVQSKAAIESNTMTKASTTTRTEI